MALIAAALMAPVAAVGQLPPADLQPDNLAALRAELNDLLRNQAMSIGFAIGASARCGHNRDRLEDLVSLMQADILIRPGDGTRMDAFKAAMESMTDYKVTNVTAFCDAAVRGLDDADKALRRTAQK